MEKYSLYKDSGVKWLGEIPSHWETRTLKYCCSLKGRIGWNGLRSEEFQYSSYAYLVTGQDFIGSEIDWSKCYQISQERYDEDPYIQLNNGDMLITKDGTIGKVAKVTNLDKQACLNSGIFVIKQKGTYFNQGFLYWMLCSNVLKEFNIYTQTGATIAHLYQNVFENMPCILPPLSEQNAIASYLDSVTTQIDVAISQQQKMIELLNERKQIIINNAVTKGLDPNVKMKDSGVDWIGEIPEGWEVRSLKTMMSIQRGHDLTAEQFNKGDFPVYGSGGLMGFHDAKTTKAPSIVIGRSGSVGKLQYVEEDFWAHNTTIYLTDNKGNDTKYLYYLLKSIDLSALATQTAVPTLDRKNILSYKVVCCLDYEEQHLITRYLEFSLSKIDSLITSINKKISLLQERKQIIINEVVTGKVKVS